jgi:cytochrome c oxidase accessory protein FixG
MQYTESLLQPEERVLSTLEKDGSRRWLYPRLSKGRFWSRRRWTAYFLIALFTAIPFIKIKGKPAMLLDIGGRQFTLFGYTFLPTDTVLLAIFMVTLILSIFAITAVLGRVWCGWACPQTVYMEYVFRPIERLCYGRTGKGGRPTNLIAAWRRIVFVLLSLLVCFYLANTFLAYFVGVEQLRHWVLRSPTDHPAGFVIVLIVTGLMAFDFLYFREQTCIIACPYGRFQSVMLDRQSMIITYDDVRGEPRGKGARGKGRGADISLPLAPRPTPLGDCVDCEVCVQVCPTGIDIRDGLQLECIGCAQCIDACDVVMDKLKMPRGLIRYSTQHAIAGNESRIIRPRVAIYSALILGFLTLLTILLVTKSATDVTLLRNLGRPFVLTDKGDVENTMRVKIVNRSDKVQRYRIVTNFPDVRVVQTNEQISLQPGDTLTEPVQIIAPPGLFKMGTLDVSLRVEIDDVNRIEKDCRLLGPWN